MNTQQLVQIINSYCLENKNEENIKKSGRFFKGGAYDGFGLTIPQIKDKIKELGKNKDITIRLICESAPLMISSLKYELPVFALLLLNERKKEFTPDVFTEIEKWYEIGIKNWAHADTLGMFILPEFLIRDIINIERFGAWIKAKNSFMRRSVPVTFIKAIKNKEYNLNDLFGFIDPLVRDPAREVHQGVGWFLREAWKLNPGVTEKFLLKWKDKAPRLIIQYACEKMSAERKLDFKRVK